jgi:alpha-L-arabinofuranosidase
MKHGRILFVAFLLNTICSDQGLAQDVIAVDAGVVVADTTRRQIGVNTNYLIDDDANRADALRGLAEALREAGVRYLRYPGGEKSDAVRWSVWPYSTSAPTLARWAPQGPENFEWPSSDPSLVRADGRTFAIDPLTFDEFMDICRAIDCVPTLVVCYDSMYKAAPPGGVAPDRALLLETAREWVRYANVTKGYNVKYWEIGNESYVNSYNGSATAADYARDLVEFSRVMKEVDPSIQIGANGHDESWWGTVLSAASGAIDFLSVHSYPVYAWGSYTYYQNNRVDLLGDVRAAENALDAYAAPADRTRIRIAATEINSADWTGEWPHVNTLGHAIVLFDVIGELLRDPRVEYSQVWNTRWIGNDTAPAPVLFDMLDRYNQLQATGRATAIWGQFLKERFVSSTSTQAVKSYASYSPATGHLSVFLINKSAGVRTVALSLANFPAAFTASQWVLQGYGSDDTYPSWTHVGEHAGSAPMTLAPVSITVLDLAPRTSVNVVPGTIEAEDFDDGLFNDWSPENYGGQYRATAVDIEASADTGGGYNIGWIDDGEWTEYSFVADAGGAYELLTRVASPLSGGVFRLFVDGADISGSVAVPNTEGWQSWTTIRAATFHLTKGPHRLRFLALIGGFNVNWISVQRAQAPVGHAVPSIIEAEDFDDGGFNDWSPENYGGAYRATAVDIEPSADTGGGFNVGWIDAGEWLEYTIAVESAGFYALQLRVASPYDGRTAAVELDGIDATGSLPIPNTEGWQRWATIRANNVYLTAGRHRVRLVALSELFNVNWISLQRAQEGDQPIPLLR